MAKHLTREANCTKLGAECSWLHVPDGAGGFAMEDANSAVLIDQLPKQEASYTEQAGCNWLLDQAWAVEFGRGAGRTYPEISHASQ